AQIRNRHSVRGIIIRDHRIAMVHLLSRGYYKFPGGGSEGTETQKETLIREVLEESGLVVKPETIKPYGIVHRSQMDKNGLAFNQDNYYYLCEAEDSVQDQHLTESEAKDRYTLEFVDPDVAIRVSRSADVNEFVELSIQRETRVLESLIAEGYFL
ncbi:MAG: NUDIX domain-containing protein, partial [Spirochaetales bacterium]|nr:NUDIX domain-containing protein [Spirochaetales bacterium]